MYLRRRTSCKHQTSNQTLTCLSPLDTSAKERWQGTNEEGELQTLENQLEQLSDESDDESLKEFDIIHARFRQLNEEYNRLSAQEANKGLEFACSICFDNNKMDALRIVNPCGHGFCKECVEKHMFAAADASRAARSDDADYDGPVCPTCRGAIASVITPYF